MATKRDYYEILGVNKTDSAAELKKAYRKKALEFHPDRNKASDAEKKFKEVNQAYEVLSNQQKRQAYDQFGHAAFDPRSGFGDFGGTRTHRQGPSTYTYSTSGGGNPFADFGFDFSDPFEIFETFFGGGASPFGQRRPQKPHYSLKVSFMEAVKGTQKTIVHQGKQYTVKIPAGANDGTRINYADFTVSVDVLPHDTFKRDGYDVFIDHEIPFTNAILGTTAEIPTIDGNVKIKIKAGTQPGTMIRLRGQGIKHLRGAGRGDQYIRLIIKLPKSLNRQQKKLLQQLKDSF